MGYELAIYTLYDHPTDYPDQFVIRRFSFDKESMIPIPDKDIFFRSISLSLCRNKMLEEMRLHRLPRDLRDDPKIIESYI